MAEIVPPTFSSLLPSHWDPGVHDMRINRGWKGAASLVDDHPSHGGRLGASVKDISRAEAERQTVSGGTQVDEVESNSPAEKSGIRKGDLQQCLWP
jgi:S1-C subfamily serine protease